MKTVEIEHTTFVVERELPGSPAHAFRFWADPKLKERWNGCHADWTVLEDISDFRTGGTEAKRWLMPTGDELAVNTIYLDVVAGERIIYAYEMSFGGRRNSASLVTIEFRAAGARTKIRVTEQGAFLGGGSHDRIQGTEEGYDRLVALAERKTADVH